jgi:hypothetical protein
MLWRREWVNFWNAINGVVTKGSQVDQRNETGPTKVMFLKYFQKGIVKP